MLKAEERKQLAEDARKIFMFKRAVEMLFFLTGGKLVLSKAETEKILGLSESSLSSKIKNGTAPERIEKIGKFQFSIFSIAQYILNEPLEDVDEFLVKLDNQNWRLDDFSKQFRAESRLFCDRMAETFEKSEAV